MALFAVDIDNLHELFVEQLRDLYDGEQQITEALPKLIEKANNPRLKNTLEEHLNVTRTQIKRLDEIFQALGEKPTGETCKGMKGVLKEGDDLVSKVKDPGIIDASIIASAQRVEHYEMAGYGTVRSFARLLGRQEFAELLDQTLGEEKEADAMLTQISDAVNVEADRAA